MNNTQNKDILDESVFGMIYETIFTEEVTVRNLTIPLSLGIFKPERFSSHVGLVSIAILRHLRVTSYNDIFIAVSRGSIYATINIQEARANKQYSRRTKKHEITQHKEERINKKEELRTKQ